MYCGSARRVFIAWSHLCFVSLRTVSCLAVLTGAQLFSLNKEELRSVIPDEGARVYSQLTVQKTLLEVNPQKTVVTLKLGFISLICLLFNFVSDKPVTDREQNKIVFEPARLFFIKFSDEA